MMGHGTVEVDHRRIWRAAGPNLIIMDGSFLSPILLERCEILITRRLAPCNL